MLLSFHASALSAGQSLLQRALLYVESSSRLVGGVGSEIRSDLNLGPYKPAVPQFFDVVGESFTAFLFSK